MRKISLYSLVLILAVVICTSCRGRKETCPAYGKVSSVKVNHKSV
ncbi:MAG: hypothetical protein Q8M29_01405 [Bacteroidota bacterium]|nr:hypothetical protein [Bacteroidota bacterium]